MYSFLDLFAGIGGMRLGFEQAGCYCIGGIEKDVHARKAYNAAYNERTHGDVSLLQSADIPDHDILIGGFPCQPFSTAGKRKGFADTRGTLFFDISRIIRDKQPKAFLLENVKGLISHDEGRTFKIILQELKKLGYTVYYKVLNGNGWVPQNRERIFIAGFKEKIVFTFPEQPLPVSSTINDILEENVDPKYFLNEKQIARLFKYLKTPKGTREKIARGKMLFYPSFLTRGGPNFSNSHSFTVLSQGEPQWVGQVNKRGDNKINKLTVSKYWAMPNKHTFTIKPIKEFVKKYQGINEQWIDPFAGYHSPALITNDLNPEIPADYHDDGLIFLQRFDDESIDGVLFDPPYSYRQVKECYNNIGKKTINTINYYSLIKSEIARIVKPGGKVLTFCWNSNGIGKSRGFIPLEIILVAHGGWHNDTICIAEQKKIDEIIIKDKKIRGLTRDSYSPSKKIIDSSGHSSTLQADHEQVKIQNLSRSRYIQHSVYDSTGQSPSLTTNHGAIAVAIDPSTWRKLTPREYGRLQGFPEEIIDKILSVNSDSQCYKLFGNSVVVPCVRAIAEQMVKALDQSNPVKDLGYYFTRDKGEKE